MEFEAIKEACASVFGVDPNEITMETSFTTDLCADSLDVYQVIVSIEQKLSMEFDFEKSEDFDSVDDAIENIVTVADAVDYIKSKRQD